MKLEIKEIIEEAVNGEVQNFSVEVSDNKIHGDYSSNVALLLAKKINSNPIKTANIIKERIKENNFFEKVEIAGPGFINFFISKKYLQNQLENILKQKEKFGNSKIGNKQKINIEFISANPTGPLTLGNGRGGFGGDVLSRVLEKVGFRVSKEYYINDTGNQIKLLGHSVLGDSEAVYKGEYIEALRKEIKGKTPEEVGQKAGQAILKNMIEPSVKKMGIRFDKWFSERSLYKSGQVDKAIDELVKKGFTYKSEGAMWFKSSTLGDDKDRVLIREDGIKTYFASDIAYLKNKFDRGFNKLIIFLGADHYGYIARLKAACHALGYDKEKIEALVLQLVKLFENGKEVRMSKRTGIYVTIDELIDEVGLDVARFFFLQRSLDTHFNFDMDLARDRSDKNPVYKVQYAYVRINSILSKAGVKIAKPKNLELLKDDSELELIKKIAMLPEIIGEVSKDYQMQRLPSYALLVADAFHRFYENCQVITEDKKLTEARLALIFATKIVLKNILELMGLSTPEKLEKNETKK
jgi:arginyl-tRNA synthetase